MNKTLVLTVRLVTVLSEYSINKVLGWPSPSLVWCVIMIVAAAAVLVQDLPGQRCAVLEVTEVTEVR